MIKDEIKLINPERFLAPSTLTKKEVEAAAARAVGRLEKSLYRFTDRFFTTAKRTNRYMDTVDVSWTTSMGTGMYWLSYELSGNPDFKKAAQNHGKLCIMTAKDNINLDDHDTGFKFLPSCVAEYKLTGNHQAREAALIAADILYEHYCKDNHFVIRCGTGSPMCGDYAYRALVDSMMNIPLFFWAYQETGDKKFFDAAVEHYKTTEKFLIREDGSSYHHYQFDPRTRKPVGGLTFQGHRDESCWARGHSWLVYGYPIAYSYTGHDEIFPIMKSVSYYFLNQLPSDFIPYWDFDFKEGSLEPRDSSAAAISACGFLEMCKHLPDNSFEKQIYKNAAGHIIKALIDKCEITNENDDGLIYHVVAAKPQGIGIDTIATYGDYFYLEALMRFMNPDWKMYW